MLKVPLLIVGGFLLSVPLAGQSLPSAEGPNASVWVGAEMSTFNPDFGCDNSSPFLCWGHHLLGFGPYVNTNDFLLQRVGVEGEARFLHWLGPGELTESTYLAGPRARLFRYREYLLSAKFLVGDARLNVSGGPGSGQYFAYAPGLTVEHPIGRRLGVRFGYEYQRWPSFKGVGAGHQHQGLTPNGFSVGVSYAVFR